MFRVFFVLGPAVLLGLLGALVSRELGFAVLAFYLALGYVVTIPRNDRDEFRERALKVHYNEDLMTLLKEVTKNEGEGSMTQHYFGTKIIMAWEQEKDGKPGYSVKYSDGYTSWSPKDVFEEAYIPMGHVDNLQPHQQRVVGEKVELEDRVTKLKAFVDSPKFQTIDADEQERLKRQLDIMEDLLDVLNERVEAF